MKWNKINDIVKKINTACNKLEYAEARNMMGLIKEPLKSVENYMLLNSNAQILFKNMIKQEEEGIEPLTRLEMLKIAEINKYCSEFDISMLKRTLNTSYEVLQRPDIKMLLTIDANVILNSMGAFLTTEAIHNK